AVRQRRRDQSHDPHGPGHLYAAALVCGRRLAPWRAALDSPAGAPPGVEDCAGKPEIKLRPAPGKRIYKPGSNLSLPPPPPAKPCALMDSEIAPDRFPAHPLSGGPPVCYS